MTASPGELLKCNMCDMVLPSRITDYHILQDYISNLSYYTDNIEVFGRSDTLGIRWAIMIRGLKGHIHKINRLETGPETYEYYLTRQGFPPKSTKYPRLTHVIGQLQVALVGESL